MNLSLTGEGDFEIQPSGPSSDTSCIVESSFDVYRETLISLDDLGCPRYFEDEVIEIDVYDGPFRFISWFRGQYVLETKVARSEPSDDMLYNIRVLHCLKGVQGIAELVGIVMDNATGKQLKSYLIKLPMARNSLQHKAGDSQVSWSRREKWAYQVVQCISHLHARGFVAGTILRIMDPVVIDSSDNVEFWGFVEHFQMGYTVGCYYPPEFRHLQTVSPMVNKADRCKATSKTDIYHLGLLLWLLAENVPRTTKSPACLRNRCDQETSKLCDASHRDPIALPLLPDCIPQYFKNIVNYCRAEKPEDRPAARDLLKLFPSRDEPVSSQTTTNCLEFTSTTTQGDTVGMRQGTSCECGRHELSSPIFHCFDCDGGDFDICVECFNKGEHCQDNTHFLVETTQVGSSMMPGRYYSAVKSSGSREVFEV